MRAKSIPLVTLALAALLAASGQAPPHAFLGAARPVAQGVDLFMTAEPALVGHPGPIAVQFLRIDLDEVPLSLALARDRIVGTETVADMARRHGALAAVNAGFFLPDGEPAGLFKLGGQVVSENQTPRGALGILARRFGRGQRLIFDQVAATLSLEVRHGGLRLSTAIDAVNTPRRRSTIVWFTPLYGPATAADEDGVEWVLMGRPLRVLERREAVGPIPPEGVVLSAGPASILPFELAAGDRAQPVTRYRPQLGTDPGEWAEAADIVGGVGLLVHRGRPLASWDVERARTGFATERHPRTMVGLARDGAAWLVTVDGRNPALSVGMSFAELQEVARRIGLVEALNLDGGGSTTMVASGAIVNHPSDAGGVRKVSDALLVGAGRRADASETPR